MRRSQTRERDREIFVNGGKPYEGPSPVLPNETEPKKTEYMQIQDSELIKYLNDGWDLKHSLNNGSHKVIVEKTVG